ncbi:MAG: hypothetical protein LC114_06750 [Bryobacterales bacterium]|nr:hypothetical protein [Bryobacterales bacterium]
MAPAQTQQHMMGGTTIINGKKTTQSSQTAISSGQKFIASQVAKASGAASFIPAGNAAHAIQDKYSPSHQGAPWKGFTALGVMGTLEHVFEDTFPGIANLKGAYQETSTMLEAVRTGTPQTYLNSNYNAAATSGATAGQQSLKQMVSPAPVPAYSGGGSVKRSK